MFALNILFIGFMQGCLLLILQMYVRAWLYDRIGISPYIIYTLALLAYTIYKKYIIRIQSEVASKSKFKVCVCVLNENQFRRYLHKIKLKICKLNIIWLKK